MMEGGASRNLHMLAAATAAAALVVLAHWGAFMPPATPVPAASVFIDLLTATGFFRAQAPAWYPASTVALLAMLVGVSAALGLRRSPGTPLAQGVAEPAEQAT